jgi:ABC-type Fe3+/spermidine/putrescine transport system ATPase subunit
LIARRSRSIAGFETLDDGSISIDGDVVAGVRRDTVPERRNVGFVFQDFALFPHLTVEENAGFGLIGEASRTRARRVRELLERAVIAELRARYPHEICGGQQQRVAPALALGTVPPDVRILGASSAVTVVLDDDSRRTHLLIHHIEVASVPDIGDRVRVRWSGVRDTHGDRAAADARSNSPDTVGRR